MYSIAQVKEIYNLGFQILPAKNKKAIVLWKEWQSARIPLSQLEAWYSQYWGCDWLILTGAISRIIGVDGDDAEAVAWMEANLPYTPVKQITAKGQHWFYLYPDFRVPNSVGFTLDTKNYKVDIRGDGGYVAYKGGTFTREQLDAMPVYNPDWIPSDPQDAPNDATDLSHDEAIKSILCPVALRVEQARAYLKGCPHSVEGNNASGYVFKIALCLLWEFALPIDATTDLLFDWGQECEPRWKASEIEHKVKDAVAKVPLETVGGKLDANWVHQVADAVHEKIKPVEPQPTETKETKTYHKVFTMSQFFDQKPTTWQIDKHITAGATCTLVAPSGNFKSFFACDMALSIANGSPFLNCFNAKKGKVGYIISEGAQGMRKRVKAWNLARAKGINDKDICFLPMSFDLTMKSGAAHAWDLVCQHFGVEPDSMFVDTVSRNAGGKDLNKPEIVQGMFDNIQTIWKSGICLVHHTGWNEQRERGASNFRDCSDATIRILKTDKLAEVKCLKQKDHDEFETYIALGNIYGQGDDSSLCFSYGEAVKKNSKFLDLFPIRLDDAKAIEEIYAQHQVWFDANGWSEKTAKNHASFACTDGDLGKVVVSRNKPVQYYRICGK